MRRYKIIGAMLDEETYKKLCEISFQKSVSKTEIIRAAIMNSELTLKCRDKGEIISEVRKGVVNKYSQATSYYFDENVVAKLKQMRMANDTNSAEIIRVLINTTDFSKLDLKSHKELWSETYEKSQRPKRERTTKSTAPPPPNSARFAVMLDETTNQKLLEFSKANDVSCAEIIRTLIDQTSPSLKVKTREETMLESRKRGTAHKMTLYAIYTNKETLDKIKKMKYELKTTYSEITRTLISNAELSKISNIRSRSKVLSDRLKGIHTGKVFNKVNRKQPSKNAPPPQEETNAPTNTITPNNTPEQPDNIS